MIKFLPSFVGSKAHWIPILRYLFSKKEDIIEPFCGSAVISANFAKTSILVDVDPIVCQIFSCFDELIVPKVFNQEDYFYFRKKEDWWKYAFCLQKMAFSGIFRYSKNGFNVPIKRSVTSISLQEEYKLALRAWKKINPTVIHNSYQNIPIDWYNNKVVILDPPYEGTQAAHSETAFDYNDYWNFVFSLIPRAKKILLFDRKKNVEKHIKINQILYLNQRRMCINGKYNSDIETFVILKTKG